MLFGSGNHDRELIFLKNAVLCLDCEAITAIKGDECPACKGHSLLNLATILGSFYSGKLGAQLGSGPFNIIVTIELEQMRARDLNSALERLTLAIGSNLIDERASLHINVQTTADNSALAKTA